MINAILAEKIDQTRRFTEDGKSIPVTLIKAGPCPVVQIKTEDHDGYWAVQLAFGSKKAKRTSKPILGHFKKAGLKKTPRFLREMRVSDKKLRQELDSSRHPELGSGSPAVKIPKQVRNDTKRVGSVRVGEEIKVGDVFKIGDKVMVTGISKGKGFAGVVKRWGFAGGPRTHGQSDRERAPGSIGQTTTPGRVHKGKKMPGRMGGERVTIKGLKIIEIDEEKDLLVVKGLVPGAKKGLLIIKKKN